MIDNRHPDFWSVRQRPNSSVLRSRDVIGGRISRRMVRRVRAQSDSEATPHE